MAGGVALNCVANGKLLREKYFQKTYSFRPAAGDCRRSIGAALAAYYINVLKRNAFSSGDG